MTMHFCIAGRQFLQIRTDMYVLLWCKVVNQRWITLDDLIHTGVLIKRLITEYMTVMVFMQSYLLFTFATRWSLSTKYIPKDCQVRIQGKICGNFNYATALHLDKVWSWSPSLHGGERIRNSFTKPHSSGPGQWTQTLASSELLDILDISCIPTTLTLTSCSEKTKLCMADMFLD